MPDDINSLKQSVFNKGRKDKFLLVFTLPVILRDINHGLLEPRSPELIKQDAVQYSIWGSPVPDTTIPAKTLMMDGQPYKVTSQTREPYQAIDVKFTVDNRFSNWWLIWKWLDVLNDAKQSGMSDHFANWQEGQDKRPKLLDREKAAFIHKNLAKQQHIAQSKSKLEEHQMAYKEELMHMANNFLDYQTIMTIYGLDEYNQRIIQFDYTNAFPTFLAGVQYNYRDPAEIESNFRFEFNQMHPKLIGAAY